MRALYVNRWASQSKKRMAKLIAAADSTEINALVIDMKDEFGLNYKSQNPEFAKNAGTATRRERRSAARHAQGAQDSPDRAHRRVQGFGDGARASRVDDSQERTARSGATRRASRG